jgi:hypothetical protein
MGTLVKPGALGIGLHEDPKYVSEAPEDFNRPTSQIVQPSHAQVACT